MYYMCNGVRILQVTYLRKGTIRNTSRPARICTYFVRIYIQRYVQLRIICAMVYVFCTYNAYIYVHIRHTTPYVPTSTYSYVLYIYIYIYIYIYKQIRIICTLVYVSCTYCMHIYILWHTIGNRSNTYKVIRKKKYLYTDAKTRKIMRKKIRTNTKWKIQYMLISICKSADVSTFRWRQQQVLTSARQGWDEVSFKAETPADSGLSLKLEEGLSGCASDTMAASATLSQSLWLGPSHS